MEIRSPLQVQAYDYLKEMILSGELEQDVLYSETRISARIGISRTPVREALRCLCQDGYITVVPSKGFMVRSLNEHDMKESIQIRCAIEGFCTQLMAAEISTLKGQKMLAGMETCLKKQEELISDSKDLDSVLESFMEYDHQFHRILISYAENREFEQLFQRLMYLIHLTTAGALKVPGRIGETLEEHRQFFACLKKGDGDRAYKLLMEHLTRPLLMDLTEGALNSP